jgi:hypothetical protein
VRGGEGYDERFVFRRLLPLFLFAALAAQGDPLPVDLRGGHFTTLTLDAKYVTAGTEEWEAFLSVDGGRFYSVRLTPHLDIAIRGYDILVPNVESSDVRILIRTGDEHVETLHPVAQRFRIHSDPDAILPLAHSASQAPEGARPGEPNVVVWSEGGRIESSARLPLQVRARSAVRDVDWDTVLPTDAIAPATQILSRPFTPQPRRTFIAARPSHDILLLSTRMNV